jgi:hypothetical protein
MKWEKIIVIHRAIETDGKIIQIIRIHEEFYENFIDSFMAKTSEKI